MVQFTGVIMFYNVYLNEKHQLIYTGEKTIQKNSNVAARTVEFDEDPSFHTRWVNTPADSDDNVLKNNTNTVGGIGIELTLDEFKEIAKANLKTFFKQYEDKLVNPNIHIHSDLGFEINADIRSQNNVRALITLLESSDAETISYKDYDNKDHDLTLDQLKSILFEMCNYVNYIYKKRWESKKKIEDAKSIDEILAIEFYL